MLCMTKIVMLLLPHQQYKKKPKTDEMAVQVLKNRTYKINKFKQLSEINLVNFKMHILIN